MRRVLASAARRLVWVLDLHRAVISRRLGVPAPLVAADRRWRARCAVHRSLTTASGTTAATAIALPMPQAPMLPEQLPATPMAARAMAIPRTVTATTSTGDTGALWCAISASRLCSELTSSCEARESSVSFKQLNIGLCLPEFRRAAKVAIVRRMPILGRKSPWVRPVSY